MPLKSKSNFHLRKYCLGVPWDDSRPRYPCKWSDCQEIEYTARKIIKHLLAKHLAFKDRIARMTCRWRECQCTFSSRHAAEHFVQYHMPAKSNSGNEQSRARRMFPDFY